MLGNKRLATYTVLTLKNETEFQGDTVLTLYCTHCGYIELYRANKDK
jgi:predicted nucleic-acid-binding Zn-ribbon protein